MFFFSLSFNLNLSSLFRYKTKVILFKQLNITICVIGLLINLSSCCSSVLFQFPQSKQMNKYYAKRKKKSKKKNASNFIRFDFCLFVCYFFLAVSVCFLHFFQCYSRSFHFHFFFLSKPNMCTMIYISVYRRSSV